MSKSISKSASRKAAAPKPSIGDPVVIDGPILAQVVSRDGNALVVAPLMDCSTGRSLDTSERWAWDADDNVDIVPALPIPIKNIPAISAAKAPDTALIRATSNLSAHIQAFQRYADRMEEIGDDSGLCRENFHEVSNKLRFATEELGKLFTDFHILANLKDSAGLELFAAYPAPVVSVI